MRNPHEIQHHRSDGAYPRDDEQPPRVVHRNAQQRRVGRSNKHRNGRVVCAPPPRHGRNLAPRHEVIRGGNSEQPDESHCVHRHPQSRAPRQAHPREGSKDRRGHEGCDSCAEVEPSTPRWPLAAVSHDIRAGNQALVHRGASHSVNLRYRNHTRAPLPTVGLHTMHERAAGPLTQSNSSHTVSSLPSAPAILSSLT